MKRLRLALALAALATLALVPSAQAEFGFVPGSFQTDYTNSDSSPTVLSGAHPHAQTTSFAVETVPHPNFGYPIHAEPLRDQSYFQIPGLAGSPSAIPTCTAAEFLLEECSASSQVGHGDILISGGDAGEAGSVFPARVFNMEPPPGVAAQFAFHVETVPVVVNATVNPEPPHNVIATVKDTSQILPLLETELTLWGVPADPSHDAERGGPAGTPRAPFLTMPRGECGAPLSTDYEITSWSGDFSSGSDPTPPMEDCETLGFDPNVSAAPTTNVAESPSGFNFSIDIDDPGLTDSDGRADSDLKKAVVTLPQEMAVNPASAGGLAACSQAQLAKETYDSAPGEGCPEASKVATVRVQTPLLTETLTGSIHLAEPYANPLGELLAGYLVIKQPERGIIVRITGRIEADPLTGQLVSSFDENPQLPFSDLEVNFTPGPRAPLITPTTCGDYEVRTELFPWSGGAPVVRTSAFTISQAPGGGPCATSDAALPHAPAFDAGTISPISKAHSPFVLNLRREDGSQRFSAVTVRPPLGLVAKLAGAETCSDGVLAQAAAKDGEAEQQSPSCPLNSQIGNVFAAAGAGPTPYWAPAKAYLSGPYKGAPLSMAVIAPAVAGPFDLGTIVSRVALHVDPKTAEITAVSDPLPTILEGIPLDIRQISVRLDKPDFTLTGTSCDPMAVTGELTSTLGAIAQLSNRFQLSDCTRLGFKPRIVLKLRGPTKRGGHPALTAIIEPRAGDANIESVSVALPRSEFLENSHIRTVCTRPDFAADNCPAGAVYGTSTVITPILGYPLTGNVYLRSSDNLLPDLVPDLRGPAHQPIRVEAAGRTDSIRGGIRNTFDFFPDAPFTKATLSMQGGNKGLLVNSRDICARVYRATARFTAHNGLTFVAKPKMQVRCGKRGKRSGKRKAGRDGNGPQRQPLSLVAAR